MYKRILAPCLTVTAFSAAVALYNSTHSLPSKARVSALKSLLQDWSHDVPIFLALSQQCCLANSELLKYSTPCSQHSHAESNGPMNAVKRCLLCSVHNSDDPTHAAGLCAEPAASLPDKRQLCQAGRGAQGKPLLLFDPLLGLDAQCTLPCTQLRMASLHPLTLGCRVRALCCAVMPDAAAFLSGGLWPCLRTAIPALLPG